MCLNHQVGPAWRFFSYNELAKFILPPGDLYYTICQACSTTQGCTYTPANSLVYRTTARTGLVCFNLNFDVSVVWEAGIPEMNMKHQDILNNKKLKWLFILEGQNKVEGQRHG